MKRILLSILIIGILLLGACAAPPITPPENGVVESSASKEIDIESIRLLGAQGMEKWVSVLVKYNKYTVPNDIYKVKLGVKLSDGRTAIIGTKEVVWQDIPGEDPMNFGRTLEFRSAILSNILAEQKTKPISERGKLDFVVTVDKTTPVTSPRYVPKQDEVAFGWRDPGSYLGYEAWLRLMNVSKSGVYIVTFTGVYIVGGTGVETVSKYIGVGESYEFRVTHRGKKVSDVKYSIDYKDR